MLVRKNMRAVSQETGEQRARRERRDVGGTNYISDMNMAVRYANSPLLKKKDKVEGGLGDAQQGAQGR